MYCAVLVWSDVISFDSKQWILIVLSQGPDVMLNIILLKIGYHINKSDESINYKSKYNN